MVSGCRGLFVVFCVFTFFVVLLLCCFAFFVVLLFCCFVVLLFCCFVVWAFCCLDNNLLFGLNLIMCLDSLGRFSSLFVLFLVFLFHVLFFWFCLFIGGSLLQLYFCPSVCSVLFLFFFFLVFLVLCSHGSQRAFFVWPVLVFFVPWSEGGQ